MASEGAAQNGWPFRMLDAFHLSCDVFTDIRCDARKNAPSHVGINPCTRTSHHIASRCAHIDHRRLDQLQLVVNSVNVRWE